MMKCRCLLFSSNSALASASLSSFTWLIIVVLHHVTSHSRHYLCQHKKWGNRRTELNEKSVNIHSWAKCKNEWKDNQMKINWIRITLHWRAWFISLWKYPWNIPLDRAFCALFIIDLCIIQNIYLGEQSQPTQSAAVRERFFFAPRSIAIFPCAPTMKWTLLAVPTAVMTDARSSSKRVLSCTQQTEVEKMEFSAVFHLLRNRLEWEQKFVDFISCSMEHWRQFQSKPVCALRKTVKRKKYWILYEDDTGRAGKKTVPSQFVALWKRWGQQRSCESAVNCWIDTMHSSRTGPNWSRNQVTGKEAKRDGGGAKKSDRKEIARKKRRKRHQKSC